MYRLFYIFRQGNLLLKESKKAVFIAVIFLTIGFVAIGSTYIVGKSLFSSSLTLKNKVNITVFLKNDTDQNDVNETINEIKAIDGVEKVEVINKEEAKEKFLSLFPQYASLLSSLDTNPFPCTVKVWVSNLELGENIKNLISSFPTVDSVIFSQDVAEKINKLTTVLWLLFVFIFIAVLAEFVFISQSITSLLVDLRHTDIKILKLIGADSTFIHAPFFFVVFVSVLLSWIISIFALKRIDLWSVTIVKSLLPFADYSARINTSLLYLELFVFGVVISIFGAIIPLRRVK